MAKQHTLKSEISFSGKGLHTGAETSITIMPGEAGSGFCLKTDAGVFPLSAKNADGKYHRTVVSVGGRQVHTVEHMLGVLSGMGVDNAVIDVVGDEVPGLDGSGKIFAEKVAEVGLVEQDAERTPLTLTEAVSVSEKGASMMAFPTDDGTFRVTYILDYPESAHAQGTIEALINPETMREGLAPCRTFVMKCHAEAMLKAGLGLGASTENTVVLDGDEVVDNELRFPAECARHKVLDVVGDLTLVGRPLAMHVVAYKSGHTLNLKLAQALIREAFRQENPRGLMDIKAIKERLPHRYPFLLVDRVLEMEENRVVALKNMTQNEEFFQGHFPGQPIMPGVLQVEALAQTGGILMMGKADAKDKLAVLMGVDSVKFRRPVVPGDQLVMEVIFEKVKGRVGVVAARSTVDGDTATEARIKFALVDPDQYAK